MDRTARSRTPVVVGVLGGVASGKSAVAQLFEEHGFVRVDADREARSVVERPEIRARIRSRFGASTFAQDGSLDRAALAAAVFDDADARRDLEAIVHPPVRAAIDAAVTAAIAGGQSVVLDVPLLLEGGLIDRCDWTVFVDVPSVERVRRGAERGWDADEVARREAHQAPLAVKKDRATVTIDNSGPLTHTRGLLAALLAQQRSDGASA